MKKLNILVLTVLITFKVLAQSTTIEPNTFKLQSSTNSCLSADYVGNIYFNTSANLLAFCVGANNSIYAAEHWGGVSPIYSDKNIGIRTGNPTYDLDISGTNRALKVFIGDKIGVGTTTPTEKVEILNRLLTVVSSGDLINWRHRYNDASDRLEIAEGAFQRVLLMNGGNVGIGGYNTVVNPKFHVEGNVNFSGNLRAGGFGVMGSTESTVQKIATTTLNITTSLSIPGNSCNTWGYSGPSGGIFNNIPAAYMGNKISGGGSDNNVLMTIENVGIGGGGTVRFCNSSNSSVTLSNMVYSIILIGD